MYLRWGFRNIIVAGREDHFIGDVFEVGVAKIYRVIVGVWVVWRGFTNAISKGREGHKGGYGWCGGLKLYSGAGREHKGGMGGVGRIPKLCRRAGRLIILHTLMANSLPHRHHRSHRPISHPRRPEYVQAFKIFSELR